MKNEFIKVVKFIEADLTILTTRISYSSPLDYYKMAFLFHENLYSEIKCDENGVEEKYSTYYGACKLEGDIVYIMKDGWVPHSAATEAYKHSIAEKELLSWF